MHLDLRIRNLPMPRISAIPIGGSVRALQEITLKNDEPSEPPIFKNRKEQMKRRLIERGRSVAFEQATAEIGRERLLLSLYLEYAAHSDAKSLLPAFNESVACSVLGTSGREWPAGRRRQATQLFFTHFDCLPALENLCDRLLESSHVPDPHASNLAQVWHEQRTTLSAKDGPQRVALAARDRETLAELMDCYAVPKEGRFSARLKEDYLLTRLQNVELGQGPEILHELEVLRTLPYQAGVPMGAAALRIMTRRTLESGSEWKGNWLDWILRIGCDPSLPAASEPFGKWWGCWHPTREELDCAQRGVNRQTLEYFIQFLEVSLRGTAGYDQFDARARFLRWLHDTRKIIRFKLLLHPRAFQALPAAYRQQRHRVAKIEGSAQGASVIVMGCTDSVWNSQFCDSHIPQCISCAGNVSRKSSLFRLRDLHSRGHAKGHLHWHMESPYGRLDKRSALENEVEVSH